MSDEWNTTIMPTAVLIMFSTSSLNDISLCAFKRNLYIPVWKYLKNYDVTNGSSIRTTLWIISISWQKYAWLTWQYNLNLNNIDSVEFTCRSQVAIFIIKHIHEQHNSKGIV